MKAVMRALGLPKWRLALRVALVALAVLLGLRLGIFWGFLVLIGALVVWGFYDDYSHKGPDTPLTTMRATRPAFASRLMPPAAERDVPTALTLHEATWATVARDYAALRRSPDEHDDVPAVWLSSQ